MKNKMITLRIYHRKGNGTTVREETITKDELDARLGPKGMFVPLESSENWSNRRCNYEFL